jgi:hypothetical protein
LNISFYSQHSISSIASPSGAMSLAGPNRIVRSAGMKSERDDIPRTGKQANPAGHILLSQAERPGCQEPGVGRMTFANLSDQIGKWSYVWPASS